jgi:hypothetical protein
METDPQFIIQNRCLIVSMRFVFITVEKKNGEGKKNVCILNCPQMDLQLLSLTNSSAQSLPGDYINFKSCLLMDKASAKDKKKNRRHGSCPFFPLAFALLAYRHFACSGR